MGGRWALMGGQCCKTGGDPGCRMMGKCSGSMGEAELRLAVKRRGVRVGGWMLTGAEGLGGASATSPGDPGCLSSASPLLLPTCLGAPRVHPPLPGRHPRTHLQP